MKIRSAIILLSVMAAILPVPAQDTDQMDPIRVDTRLVSVPVIVGDRNGRYVPDLRSADFAVFHDGKRQRIDFFAPVEEPLTIALLIDTSLSTRPVLGAIKDAARSLIKVLSPQDRAMIVAFDYDVHILSELTSDPEQLSRAVKDARIPEFLGTRLRDAAFRTISRSFAGIEGRKALIVLTDGKDVDSRISRGELMYALQESDTMVYTVMFRTGHGRSLTMRERFFEKYWRIRDGRNTRSAIDWRQRVAHMNERAVKFLHEISESTGGRFYITDNIRLKHTFSSIVDELKFQYRLGFYPPDHVQPDQLYEIKVKVDRPDVVVRSRTNYRIQR